MRGQFSFIGRSFLTELSLAWFAPKIIPAVRVLGAESPPVVQEIELMPVPLGKPQGGQIKHNHITEIKQWLQRVLCLDATQG